MKTKTISTIFMLRMHEPLDVDKIPLQEQEGYPKEGGKKECLNEYITVLSDSNIRADIEYSFSRGKG